jgi:hypothetical protein
MSESAFRREFAEKGFWQKTDGMLVILTPQRLARFVRRITVREGWQSGRMQRS